MLRRCTLTRAALVAAGAGIGCSLILDTSGLSLPPEELDAGQSVDASFDSDAPDSAADAGAVDAGGLTLDEAGCPRGRGPAMVRIEDGHGTFCVDATEVTNAQRNAFLAAPPGDLPSPPASCSFKSAFGGAAGPDDAKPATGVDWCDAWMICAWAGKRLCGSRNGTTINSYSRANDPAISEWYAACSRSGARAYPYGAAYVADACNGCERTGACASGGAPLVTVASLTGCAGGYDGLFDMSGNVAEWEDNCNASGGANREQDTCPPRGGGRRSEANALQCTVVEETLIDAKRSQTSDAWGVRCCAP
jgi:formylglycine-generating enzyme